jgi:hypothetical protein
MLFPQTAPIVDDIFGPVTWHHQRRPSSPCLGLQNKKDPPGLGRRNLLQRSSQSSVFKERREREGERELERIIDSAQIIFVPPFISLHAICPFCPCQAQGPMETSNILSDLI